MDDEAPEDADPEPDEGDEEPAPSDASDPGTPTDEEPASGAEGDDDGTGPEDDDGSAGEPAEAANEGDAADDAEGTDDGEGTDDADDADDAAEADDEDAGGPGDADGGDDEDGGEGTDGDDAPGASDAEGEGEPEPRLGGDPPEFNVEEHRDVTGEPVGAEGDDEEVPDVDLDPPEFDVEDLPDDPDADPHSPPEDHDPSAHWPEETRPDDGDDRELADVEDEPGTLVGEDGEATAVETATSDGGYADEVGSPAGAGTGAGGAVHEGAPDDEEMPLADHIEEMVKRLGVVVVVMAVVSGVVFPFGEDLINFLWYSFLPGTLAQCPENVNTAACPRVYQPLALILARLKVATLVGFIAALPVFVYETYLFMRPGLYPRERRYYLASVPTSLVLAAVGVAFAYFLVLPTIFTYFVFYSEGVTVIAFGLTETFDLMVLLMGFFAIVFQIPLFVMLAIMMGLTTRQWLADRRLYFWGAFLGIAFLFSPDPTGMAPIIVAATMVALFEGTLLLLKWTRRG